MKNYIDLAGRTVSSGWNSAVRPNIIHAALGIASEGGEIVDLVKRSLFYGKPLDKPKLIEEMGDVLWYMALMMAELGTDFDVVQRLNIEKLRKRFPDGFSDLDANFRNLDAEGETFAGLEGAR